MSFLVNNLGGFVFKHTVGEPVSGVFQEAGRLCENNIQTSQLTGNRFSVITAAALKGCHDFTKLCARVAAVALVFSFMPFFLGTLGSSTAVLSSLTYLLVLDLTDMIETFSKLDQKDQLSVTQFDALTKTGRVEFFVKNTFILGWAPTHFLEKLGASLGLLNETSPQSA